MTKLYHEEGGVAQVGQPLVDIDVDEEEEGQQVAAGNQIEIVLGTEGMLHL